MLPDGINYKGKSVSVPHILQLTLKDLFSPDLRSNSKLHLLISFVFRKIYIMYYDTFIEFFLQDSKQKDKKI